MVLLDLTESVRDEFLEEGNTSQTFWPFSVVPGKLLLPHSFPIWELGFTAKCKHGTFLQKLQHSVILQD